MLKRGCKYCSHFPPFEKCSSYDYNIQRGMQIKLCHSFISAVRKLNAHSIVARTGLFFPQISSARLVFPAFHVFGIENRRFYAVMEGDVVHDKDNNLFFVKLTNDGGKAVLEYEKINSTTLDFYHTGVPVSHRGQGIAKHLVQAGFDYAISEKLKVKPTCSYVLKYVNEHDVRLKNNVIIP